MEWRIRRAVAPVAILGSIVALLVGGAAQAEHGHAPGKATRTLTVFAAASLKEAFTAIGKTFGARNRAAVRFNFGGSDALATDIVQGAPADVFASANGPQMTVLRARGLIAGTPTVFVRNRLVVIVPASNPGHVYSLPDLGRLGLRLVLAAPTVPVGRYARAAFTVMASDAAFGPDFLRRIKANTVSNELDVKAVANKVMLGEADAGVVYVTDVTPQVARNVQRIDVPAPYNQVSTYPIAVVKGSANAALARRFVAYVLSSAGQAVLKARGFITGGTPGGYASSLRVAGLVGKPATLTVRDLRRLPAASVAARLRNAKGTIGTTTYTGVLLNTVVQSSLPLASTSFKNDMLRQFVTVGATDGYAVTVAMAEILPQFGGQRMLLAYSKNGKLLSRREGAVELIVPGDRQAGRDVTNVDSIVVGTPLGTP